MNFNTHDFLWWTGVVEDRNDPMMLGRLRVRIFGIHTDQMLHDHQRGIKTDELPWAYPMQPITSAAMNGIGNSPTGIVEGTHVVGFFRDGSECQDPIIMGSIGGVPQDRPEQKGFNDPNGKYPKFDPYDETKNFIGEPDTNRLARGYENYIDPDNKTRNTDLHKTYVPGRSSTRDLKVERAISSDTWDEPEVAYNSKYPKNHVRESESGHIEEWDDTPDNERLHKRHRTGTFEEIYPDGKKVTKVVNDNYSIVLGDEYIHIKDTNDNGNLNVTVDGNVNMLVKKDAVMEVEGDLVQKIHKNWKLEVKGNANWIIGDLQNTSIGGSWNIYQTNNIITKIDGFSQTNIAKTSYQQTELDTTFVGGPNIHLNP